MVKDIQVITLDMALYEKAIQLVDFGPELRNKYILRLRELHACMAMIRAIGSMVENSGIDDVWIEFSLYGPSVVSQLLGYTQYYQPMNAHQYTYLALFQLLLDAFFEDEGNIYLKGPIIHC